MRLTFWRSKPFLVKKIYKKSTNLVCAFQLKLAGMLSLSFSLIFHSFLKPCIGHFWSVILCSAVQTIFQVATHGIATKKSPCSPKIVFIVDNHYKRDSIKLQISIMTLSIMKVLIHGGDIFVKLSLSQEDRFKPLCRHHNVKSIWPISDPTPNFHFSFVKHY